MSNLRTAFYKSRNNFLRTIIMEAMALGFPVVTTKVGGIPYLFEDGAEGIMVTPDHVDDMVEAIIGTASEQGKGIAIGQAARAKAEQWLALLTN